MALSSFLNVNGYDFPPPRRGFSWTITTTVNGGRNENNAVIGQRVGRICTNLVISSGSVLIQKLER